MTDMILYGDITVLTECIEVPPDTEMVEEHVFKADPGVLAADPEATNPAGRSNNTGGQMTIVVACALVKDGKLLMSRRMSDGLYGVPAGKHEEGESLKGCGVRELREETGIVAHPSDLMEVGFCERPNQVIFWYLVSKWVGEPRTMEPKKHGEWTWLYFPSLKEVIPGLKLFKAKLLDDVLEEVRNVRSGC